MPDEATLRAKIMAAQDIVSRTVEVPEWGVTLTLQSPTVAKRAELVKSFANNEGNVDVEKMYPALLIATVVGDDGQPLFTDADTEALMKKNGAVIDRIATEALKVAGLDPEAVDRGKDGSSPSVNAAT